MRAEQIISKALERTGNDRYRLCALVFSRVKELSNGDKPLLSQSEDHIKKMDLSDIALQEIAEGKITLVHDRF